MITVVLDDDPTGTQAVSDVPVVIDWRDKRAWEAVQPGDRAVHILTNSRAYDGAGARDIVASAAAAARSRFSRARILLRGDSTLRAHVWEEYDALRAILAPHATSVPLVLTPALPAAGRVTVDATHLLERDGRRIALHETEYSRDGALAYSTAHLPSWAEQRSQGRLAASDARCIPLEPLRHPDGARRLAREIRKASRLGRPSVVVPDAESDADLRTVAAAVELAEGEGSLFLIRAAPAFVAALTGATEAVSAPPMSADGVLVVCGSFVSGSTLQLEHLVKSHPGSLVLARVAELAGDGAAAEIARATSAARDRLDAGCVAVVATERLRDHAYVDPAAQRRIAVGLAQIVQHVDPGVVVAKGGITSAVTVREGLSARSARVCGPVMPGVSRWRLDDGRDYLVVPGNVGGPDLLSEVVASILAVTRATKDTGC